MLQTHTHTHVAKQTKMHLLIDSFVDSNFLIDKRIDIRMNVIFHLKISKSIPRRDRHRSSNTTFEFCLSVCLSIAHSLHWGHIFFIYSFIWQKMKFNFLHHLRSMHCPWDWPRSYPICCCEWMKPSPPSSSILVMERKIKLAILQCILHVQLTLPVIFSTFQSFLIHQWCVHCTAYFHSLWMAKWTIYQLIIKLNQTFSHSFHWNDWLIDVIQKCQKQQLVILLMLNTVERIKADNQSKTRTLCLAPDGRNSDFENFRTFFTAVIIKW